MKNFCILPKFSNLIFLICAEDKKYKIPTYKLTEKTSVEYRNMYLCILSFLSLNLLVIFQLI